MSAPNAAQAQPAPVAIPLAVTNARRWTIVGLLFFASLINYFDRATVSFAMPILSKDLGLGPSEKGTLLAAFFWSYALMQIPMGLLADRVNLRWLYAASFVIWSVAQGLMGMANTLTALILLRMVLGIGEAIYLPGGTRVVSLFFPLSQRGLPCGLFDFGTRTGLVLEGVIVPSLVYNYGWRATFGIVGLSALLWLIPWFWATPARMQCPPENRPPEMPKPHWKESFALLRNRDLIGICLGFFCFDYYWYLLVTWLPDYMVNVRHLTLQWAGIYTALPFLVFGVSQPLGGWIADAAVKRGWNETRTRKGIISIAFLMGLLLIPAAQASEAKVALAFLMAGCLVGLSTANQLVILQNCAPPAQIGLWVGIYNFVGNLAGIAAPTITGILIERTGSYTPAFVLAAVMIAAGQLAYWFIVGPLQRK
jgi:MFS transporter, ACS family, D-galactonate transporter